MNRILHHVSFLIAAVAGSSLCAAAQQFTPSWAGAISSTGGVSVSKAIVDRSGNCIIAGAFSGTADFDPGPGVALLAADTAFGKGSTFFAVFSRNADLLYVRQFGAPINAMAVDGNGDLILAGSFSGTKDFDPGSGTASITSNGRADIYLARFNGNGELKQAFSVGGVNNDEASAIAVDASNNVYITGNFSATVDFDPARGGANLTSNGPFDIYAAKYTAGGALVRGFKLDGVGSSEEGVALAVDKSNNLLLNGRFTGTLDLDPGPGTTSVLSNGVDGFLARYDASGNFLSGNNYDGNAYAMGLDRQGNIWLSGTLSDSMDADLGAGRAMLYSVNNSDIFTAKYDPVGNFLHARAYASNSIYTPDALVCGTSGEAYFSGRFTDSVTFNPGGAGGRLTSAGGQDGFLVQCNPDGSFVKALSVGSTGTDRIFALAADHTNGALWAAGFFVGTIDVDPGSSTLTLNSSNQGGFLVRYEMPATGIRAAGREQAEAVAVYGAEQAVIVDFTKLERVDARVRVSNMLGQTVIETTYRQNDMLRIPLPGPAQVYVVSVDAGAASTRSKASVR